MSDGHHTSLMGENAHPRTRIDHPRSVEGGIMYTSDAMFIFLFFPFCLKERKITSHSGRAILEAADCYTDRRVTHYCNSSRPGS